MTSAADVIAAIREVVPGPAQLHEPDLRGSEQRYVAECIESGWVSSVGAFVDRFERDLTAITDLFAVATSNGTAALHAALRLVDVMPGDEVLSPALTFVATTNAIAYCGATPHFVDAETSSYGVDPGRLERHLERIAVVREGKTVNRQTGRRLAALVCVHVFGHPCQLDELARIADRFELPLVEDAAEALGATFDGTHVGHRGRVATLSFNGNKVVTTGGGGALLTRDAALARRAKHLTTTARVADGFEFSHDELGWNYRMPNINAALGCAQLERLTEFLTAKRALGERYAAALSRLSDIRFVVEPPRTRSSYWLHAIVLEGALATSRDAVLAEGVRAGLGLRPVWKPMHLLPMYREAPRDSLEITESLWQRTVNLPSSAFLGQARPS